MNNAANSNHHSVSNPITLHNQGNIDYLSTTGPYLDTLDHYNIIKSIIIHKYIEFEFDCRDYTLQLMISIQGNSRSKVLQNYQKANQIFTPVKKGRLY